MVRDRKVHEEVIVEVTTFACGTGFELIHLDYSPIKGPEGNIEYLLYARKNEKDDVTAREESLQKILLSMPEVVGNAHGDLDK